MATKKIAINGFGRIGRTAFKIALDKKDLEVVAVNNLSDTRSSAHLLKYDTVYGKFGKDISYDEHHLIVEGKRYQKFNERDPAKLPWKRLGIDVVLECTGIFRTADAARAHITAGSKAVVISAPARDEVTPTVVRGVNSGEKIKQDIVSNASCTTNCIAPVAAIMERLFGVGKAMMTTIHAYTANQNVVDASHKDLRRARAAAQNIIPTTTGAATATAKTIPSLQGIFDGLAMRVPVVCGSLADLTFLTKKKTSVEEVNAAFQEAAKSDQYQGIVAVTEEPIVSSDIIGNPASAIVDLGLTRVVDSDLVKVVAWYDNEWGYAHRLVEVALLVGEGRA